MNDEKMKTFVCWESENDPCLYVRVWVSGGGTLTQATVVGSSQAQDVALSQGEELSHL